MIGPVDPLDELPAIAVAGPRRALRRSLLSFSALLVVGLTLLVVAATIAVGVARTARSIDDGVAASATVVDLASRPANARSNRDGTVTIEFRANGALQRTDVKVFQIDRYREGQTVDIRYADGDPGTVGIVGEDTVTPGVPWIVVAVFGLVLVLMASVALRHVFQTRRILRDHEWLAMPAVVRALPFEVGLRQRALRVVIVQDPANNVAVSAEPIGLKRLPDDVAPMAWVAGLGGPRFVVAPPGGRRIVLVEKLKRRRRNPVPGTDPHAHRISRRYRVPDRDAPPDA